MRLLVHRLERGDAVLLLAVTGVDAEGRCWSMHGEIGDAVCVHLHPDAADGDEYLMALVRDEVAARWALDLDPVVADIDDPPTESGDREHDHRMLEIWAGQSVARGYAAFFVDDV